MANMVRKSVYAGTWYPGGNKELRTFIRQAMDQSEAPTIEARRIQALIVPHAGYVYSGKAAAAAYRLLKGRDIRRVFLLGPSHRAFLPGIATGHYQAYLSPMGRIPLDRDTMEQLIAGSPHFLRDPGAQAQEHSLEIQLPFLQYFLTDFTLTPLLVGNLDGADIPHVAAELEKHIDDHTLLVASSDFTHYGPGFGYTPFESNIRQKVQELDMGAVALIEKKDTAGFLRYVEQTGATICGYLPIAIVLAVTAKQPVAVSLLDYYTSGQITGDYANSVSYAALAIHQ